ncbi:hypothetical protein AciM339_1382 [Aciduliprofundum sp. MAR08-339]|uniref:hypothetical protein n=1 Tax=Aciduliprofundum sp. (strain MAR08-339) TaxID=673860 RepID=UPI0002A48278|nr:hypothetical protein AciM339_1382 [Aciduliprofundum sp. MAR08-339]
MLLDEIEKWLREGNDDAQDLVDLPWNVERENNTLMAQHPKIPFILYVSEDDNFIRLRVYTGIETAVEDTKERLKIARALLLLNGSADYLKFALEGINEEVVLQIDLGKKYFNKGVFEDSIAAMVTGMYMMVRALDLEEEFQNQLFARLVGLVKERLSEGAKREDVVKFLINRVGLKKKDAEEIVDEIMKSMDKDIKGYM